MFREGNQAVESRKQTEEGRVRWMQVGAARAHGWCTIPRGQGVSGGRGRPVDAGVLRGS